MNFTFLFFRMLSSQHTVLLFVSSHGCTNIFFQSYLPQQEQTWTKLKVAQRDSKWCCCFDRHKIMKTIVSSSQFILTSYSVHTNKSYHFYTQCSCFVLLHTTFIYLLHTCKYTVGYVENILFFSVLLLYNFYIRTNLPQKTRTRRTTSKRTYVHRYCLKREPREHDHTFQYRYKFEKLQLKYHLYSRGRTLPEYKTRIQ